MAAHDACILGKPEHLLQAELPENQAFISMSRGLDADHTQT